MYGFKHIRQFFQMFWFRYLKNWYQSNNIYRRYRQRNTGGVSNYCQCMYHQQSFISKLSHKHPRLRLNLYVPANTHYKFAIIHEYEYRQIVHLTSTINVQICQLFDSAILTVLCVLFYRCFPPCMKTNWMTVQTL